MSDLISRQSAIDALWKERQQLDDYMDEFLKKGLTALRAGTKAERNRIEEDIYIIKELPSTQAERKSGRWIEEPNCWYRCSQCGKHFTSILGHMGYNFCPNCGAEMERRSE